MAVEREDHEEPAEGLTVRFTSVVAVRAVGVAAVVAAVSAGEAVAAVKVVLVNFMLGSWSKAHGPWAAYASSTKHCQSVKI